MTSSKWPARCEMARWERPESPFYIYSCALLKHLPGEATLYRKIPAPSAPSERAGTDKDLFVTEQHTVNNQNNQNNAGGQEKVPKEPDNPHGFGRHF